MKDDISHEVKQTVTTNFLQFALGDDEYHHPDDMKIIDCNHIRIGTFITENEEPLSLCVDTGAPKSVIHKNK